MAFALEAISDTVGTIIELSKSYEAPNWAKVLTFRPMARRSSLIPSMGKATLVFGLLRSITVFLLAVSPLRRRSNTRCSVPQVICISRRRRVTKFYLYARSVDGSNRRKVLSNPIVHFATISPDRQWIVAEAPPRGRELPRGVMAYNMNDGSSKRVYYNVCFLRWTNDAKFLWVSLPGGGVGSTSSAGPRSFLVPLRRGQAFPEIPPIGNRAPVGCQKQVPYRARTVHL